MLGTDRRRGSAGDTEPLGEPLRPESPVRLLLPRARERSGRFSQKGWKGPAAQADRTQRTWPLKDGRKGGGVGAEKWGSTARSRDRGLGGSQAGALRCSAGGAQRQVARVRCF